MSTTATTNKNTSAIQTIISTASQMYRAGVERGRQVWYSMIRKAAEGWKSVNPKSETTMQKDVTEMSDTELAEQMAKVQAEIARRAASSMSHRFVVGENDETFAVKCPFNVEANEEFRKKKGKFEPESKTWTFNIKDREAIIKVLKNVFGADGEPMVDVKIRIKKDDIIRTIYAFGRTIVSRGSRDKKVEIGNDVVIDDGDFPKTGGSANYPMIKGKNVILEVRNVPASLAQKFNNEELEVIQ